MKKIKVDREEKKASSKRGMTQVPPASNHPTQPTPQKEKAELQQKLIIYQLMQKRLEELQQQAMLIERRYAELEVARNTISDLEKTKKGGEMFFPLGSGVYAKGNVHEDKALMVELGAGLVSVKKPRAAQDFLEEKKKEIEASGKDLEKELKTTAEKMNEIAHQVQEAASQD
jgi:prefoldin alpha subunit